MSDIVERWKEELESLGGKPMTTAEHYANDLAGIVESLRQRVKELEVLAESRLESLSAVYVQLDALKTGRNALAEFNECWSDEDGNDPIERLRFFCSLAMRGQDWLDVEPFFDALKQSQGEPVGYARYIGTDSGTEFHSFAKTTDGWNDSFCKPLYTAADMADAQAKAFREAIPEGWLRAIDEELVVTFIGVANTNDSYETARKKLHELIDWHIAVATDPFVNGGWRLVPIELTEEMVQAGLKLMNWDASVSEIYETMLAAAPKPEDVK